VPTVTVRIPRALVKRAQTATGRRDATAAVRRALELATHDYELNAASRRALEQSAREERENKVRRFRTARDAIAHLKRL
jgi:Arc/MetJ-type ribon-helix-helix transcriptional regulator